jgi:DNA (cytosine-5)-methyltransferase 1
MKPLVDNTLRRIAAGLQKYVLGKRAPFIVELKGTDDSQIANSNRPVTEPLSTVHAGGTHHLLVTPYLTHRGNGERPGQEPRTYDATKPLGTIVAQGKKQMLVAAFLAKHYGGHVTPGSSVAAPIGSLTTQDHHHLVCAFLVKYYGTSTAQAVTEPIGALTTHYRYALCTVDIDGETYRIVDIRTRMLNARELARCQGFPDSYVLDPVIGYVGRGRKRRPVHLRPTAQVRMIGNSVVPLMAELCARAAHGVTMRHQRQLAACA